MIVGPAANDVLRALRIEQVSCRIAGRGGS
jgi:hypothetical protein